jgi:uncharacterized membrane protein YeiH
MLPHVLDLLAIVAEAMSSAPMRMCRGLARLGLCLVAALTTLGGGHSARRPAGHYPLAWVSHPDYVLITIETAVAAAMAACFTLRMLTVRFCWQLKMFTAADSGGAS